MHFGSLSYNTTLKLSNGECLNVLNIGGSISCGHSLHHHPDNPHGKNDAYPTFLERYLNTMWPCKRDNHHGVHKLSNWCYGGRPTVSWIDEVVSTRMGEPKVLFNADIILIDTSLNDLKEDMSRYSDVTKNDSEGYVKKVTELFIKILSKLPQGPSLIYVGSGTRVHDEHTPWRKKQTRTGDAVATHLPVTNYYHIPYVSIMDAMGPFVTEESLQWFSNIFTADNYCHPTKTGHRMDAAIIYNILQLHRDAATSNDDEYMHNAHIDYYDKPPLYASPELINQYAISVPLVIHLDADKIHKSPGSATTATTTATSTATTADGTTITADSHWSVYEDKPGKPGFISSTVGSTFQVRIPQSAVQTHLKSGHIHIEVLKSYEHVGRVKVSIGIQIDTIQYTATSPPSTTSPTAPTSVVDTIQTSPTPSSSSSSSSSLTSVYHKLDERVIDCIWPDKSSQRSVEEFRLNLNTVNTYMSPSPPTHASPTTSATSTTSTTASSFPTATLSTSTSSLQLNFTVIPSIPIRKNNKIKMFSILLM